MQKIKIIFFLFLISSPNFAQSKNVALLFKAGSANYDLVIPIGMNSNVDMWDNGLQLSAGLEYPLYENISIQGQFYYSKHRFIKSFAYNIIQEDPKIRLIDFMCNLKWNVGYFYLIGGLGLSLQKTNEMGYYSNYINGVYSEKPVYTELIFLKKDNEIVKAALLGLGTDIPIWRQFNLVVEANVNVRNNWGTALLLGTKYNLFQ